MAEYHRDREFEEKIVQINRVSKKTTGGNKIGFSVLVVVGDKNGRVGVGLGKAPGVQDAIKKASAYAKKHLLQVPMRDTTIPHEVYIKLGAAKVLLKPAARGTGVIAGGAVRAVVEAAGIKDILSKVLGTSNQASNVYAALEALRELRTPEQMSRSVRSEKKVIAKEDQVVQKASDLKEKVEDKVVKPKVNKTPAKPKDKKKGVK